MLTADVIIAGGGIAGLLLASAMPPGLRVVLIERARELPRRKYWLTDAQSADTNPHLAAYIDSHPKVLDFIAADRTSTSIPGRYVLWNTVALSNALEASAREAGVTFLTGRRIYAAQPSPHDLIVHMNADKIRARLLVDCMGCGSPIVGAYGTVSISGYYVVHGAEVSLRHSIRPVGLHNVVAGRTPTYFELFPTAQDTAHAAVILPSRTAKPGVPLKAELDFILSNTPYADVVDGRHTSNRTDYFGIIPVGRQRRTALDRILFFGESAQSNPAASATGLTRMLLTYRAMATHVVRALEVDRLDAAALAHNLPKAMSPMNRAFQECLFERILEFNSADFSKMVHEMGCFPAQAVHDLIFASFLFRQPSVAVAKQLFWSPNGHFASALSRAVARRLGVALSRGPSRLEPNAKSMRATTGETPDRPVGGVRMQSEEGI